MSRRIEHPRHGRGRFFFRDRSCVSPRARLAAPIHSQFEPSALRRAASRRNLRGASSMCNRTFSSLLLANLLLVGGCGEELSVVHEQQASTTASDATSTEEVQDSGARMQPATASDINPDHLRKGPGSAAYEEAEAAKEKAARYETGIQRKDFGFDLSKVKLGAHALDKAGGEVEADHDHDHDHASHATGDAPETGGLRPPNLTALGRIAMHGDSPQSHEFGSLRQGSLGEHRFEFISNGEVPLIINTAKPSCGCTKAELLLLNADGSEERYVHGSEIPIGQRFCLDTEITTDGKPAGPFSAQVQMYGNDPRGAFNVRMTAEIKAVLEVKPSMTAFLGRITTADSAEQMVTIQSVSGEVFGLEPNPKGIVEPLKVTLTPKDQDADGRAAVWEAHLSLGPDIPVGMRYYPVLFKSDIPIPHPKYPSKNGEISTYIAQVNVQAQVVGMVHAEPNFVNFGIVRPITPVERTLQLEVHDDFKLTADIPIQIQGFNGQEFPFPKAFKTSVTPAEDGRTAEVKLTLEGLPMEHTGSFGGMLNIEIGHPNMPELQVRFSGVARQDLRRK